MMIKILLCSLLLICLRPSAQEHTGVCSDLQQLSIQVRDGQVSRTDALKKFQVLIPQVSAYYRQKGGKAYTRWVFPLKGYTPAAIGGKNGNGYIAAGYSYFDGNKHKGHPAHDIFIADRNQDGLDDRSGSDVQVLSVSGGVVVATETQWEETSTLRGGKYIWIFDPSTNSLFYYAHNKTVLVKAGELVKPGDAIAAVGRTGMNACKKRSPTHLHFMQVKLDENLYPRPVNPYSNLLHAETIR